MLSVQVRNERNQGEAKPKKIWRKKLLLFIIVLGNLKWNIIEKIIMIEERDK